MMFGRDDNKTDDTTPEPQHDAVLDSGDMTTEHPEPVVDGNHTSPAYTPDAPTHDAPNAPVVDDTATAADDDGQDTPPTTLPEPSDRLDDHGNGDLLDIKQSALRELTPLVDHLDQSPEEKFRTTMMMIQASDNQDLIKDAYDAAQKITDEKAKAQALLDIVNEINYFSQQHPEN